MNFHSNFCISFIHRDTKLVKVFPLCVTISSVLFLNVIGSQISSRE